MYSIFLNLLRGGNWKFLLIVLTGFRAMNLPFFVEDITGSGILITKDYIPTQVTSVMVPVPPF